MIYGHGDEYGGKSLLLANFSTNIPTQFRNAKLQAHLVNKVSSVSHYPDPDASHLAAKLARKYQLEDTSVMVTNGATEAFYLISEIFSGKRSLIFTPSFAEYEDACVRHKHLVKYELIGTYKQINPCDYDLVWLCNPNNPDGRILDLELVHHWLKIAPETTFIIDEAYIEFSKGLHSMLPHLSSYINLIVVRSMTKRYVIPGLRLGFIAAHTDLIDKIKPLLMPWRINQLAIEAGLFIADDAYSDDFCEKELVQESQWLQKEINKLNGFKVVPSVANFFLVEGDKPASELKKWLLKNHNILIRDASNFRGLGINWFRIATADRDDNIFLLKALLEWSRIG